jgi:hypothetical protein
MDGEDSASRESSHSSSEEPVRPNRWTGPPSTWQSLTAQERGLEASLVELRNRDLSIHLYNSFSLKTNARKYRESKNLQSVRLSTRKSQEIDEPNEEGEDAEEFAAREWAPSKVWTAWPLPPDQVPRPNESVGPDDDDEMFTLKRRDEGRPSRELEDVLVGTALKFAKQRWEKRDMASSEENFQEETSAGEQTEEEELKRANSSGDGHEDNLSDQGTADEGHKNVDKEPSQSSPEEAFLEPILSPDDERSRDLLRPSIRHTLSQLDAVLMALHHARHTCHRYAAESEMSSDDDAIMRSDMSEMEPVPSKKPVGRPRKFENLTSRPRPVEGQVSEPINANFLRAKKTHRGRPRKHYDILDGETQEEYLIRVARIQKKALPSFASSRATSQEGSPLKGRRGPRKRERLGIRDWSEVVGSAALVGLPPDVIARATQRCASLFGESMNMMHLVETPARTNESHVLKTYAPEEIPDLTCGPQSSQEESGDDDIDMEHEVKKPQKRLPRRATWTCPVENCLRQNQGFTWRSRLVNHLKAWHKMSDSEVADSLDDSKATHGAVHVDGFLKPIKNIPGVRGADRGSRSRGRWTNESIQDEAVFH